MSQTVSIQAFSKQHLVKETSSSWRQAVKTWHMFLRQALQANRLNFRLFCPQTRNNFGNDSSNNNKRCIYFCAFPTIPYGLYLLQPLLFKWAIAQRDWNVNCRRLNPRPMQLDVFVANLSRYTSCYVVKQIKQTTRPFPYQTTSPNLFRESTAPSEESHEEFSYD